MFRHPKYYKELRKRNKTIQEATRQVESQQSDQAISNSQATADDSVRPGPGPKHQASSSKDQASSVKHQALKLSNQPG